MPEDTTVEHESRRTPEWTELAPGKAEVVNLTPEGRSDVMGGEIVAMLRFGEPLTEVHVASVHEPNEHFGQLLRWNGIDPNVKTGIVLLALNEVGRPSGGITASALLIPGKSYGLGGGEGGVKWFKYGVAVDPVEPWTPFDQNPSLRDECVKLDLAAEHMIIVADPNMKVPVQLSESGLY